MDVIAYWEPWAKEDDDVESMAAFFYDAMWFLKRSGDYDLGFRTIPRWWDPPTEVQPQVEVSLTTSQIGALEFHLAGNEYRRANGDVELEFDISSGLRDLGWLSPERTGSLSWQLPPPSPMDGFVERYANILAETCLFVFFAEVRHLLLAFVRHTPPGATPYQAPLPFLLENERDIFY